MVILDGNNSQKRSATAKRDPRIFKSDYYLTPPEVNTFRKVVSVKVPKETRNEDVSDSLQI
jgi:Kyakuja-Dileera-Zisupton transposase